MMRTRSRRRRRSLPVLAAALLVASTLSAVVVTGVTAGTAAAAPVAPSGFTDQIAIGGLNAPTQFSFAPDGTVFVAEKSGLVKRFPNASSSAGVVVADLRTEVMNFSDRGLLGLAVDPHWPARPYVYVSYTFNAPIGGTAPVWGTPPDTDTCPDPPGANTNGCVVSGRLSKLTLNPTTNTLVSEQVLINAWCQQFPSHSMGGINFGPDGYLYMTGGEGASFDFTDYGQAGSPVNPCGDPPGGVGGVQTLPTAEGGALRAQDLETRGNPVGLSGSLIRVDPDTGLGVPTNPLAGDADVNAQRIIAYGFRNPFRSTIDPVTGDVYVGNVGWSNYEAVDEIPAGSTTEKNFGWPCQEGASYQPGSYAQSNICQSLYSRPGSITAPFLQYSHTATVGPNDKCALVNGSSISGLAVAPQVTPFPQIYHGAMFLADYARSCIWVMYRGADGKLDPTTVQDFIVGAPQPVDMKFGPDGNLYYANVGGAIRRVTYADQLPTAIIASDHNGGSLPTTIQFDGTTSTDDGGSAALKYSWDLNGDGVLGDSTSPTPSWTYTVAATITVTLQVTDASGNISTATMQVYPGQSVPIPTIDTPTTALHYVVGQPVSFSGHAIDATDGVLPASDLHWQVIINHCPKGLGCHQHVLQTFDGVSSGTINAPDHEYPSNLEFQLTATNSVGQSAVTDVIVTPTTTTITLNSRPTGGMYVTLNSDTELAPYTYTVISGSINSVGVNSPQTPSGGTATFQSWSDGGDQTHLVTATPGGTSLTANFAVTGVPILSVPGVSILEGNTGTPTAVFTLTLSQPAATATSVAVATETGTADLNDYWPLNTTINFAAGQTVAFAYVGIKPDTVPEPDETYSLVLSNPSGLLLDRAAATGTILNDDVAVTPTISIGDASVVEGNTGTTTTMLLPITLSAAATGPVTVQVNSADGTATLADQDYYALSTTVTIPAGQTTAYAYVGVRGDVKPEANETFTVTLSAPTNATIARPTATGTIIDDDTPILPTVSIADGSILEGNAGTTVLALPITLSAASASAVTVQVATADGTATIANQDYYALGTTITIPAGATTATAYVGIRGDTLSEPDETFTVNLLGPTNATLGKAQGVVTILNDDGSIVPTLSIGDAAVVEGNSGQTVAVVPITMSSPVGSPVTVQVNSADQSATLAGQDYYALNTTVTIPAGATVGYAYVGVRGDTVAEPTETLAVNLSNPTNATVADGQGIVTILDDDPPPASALPYLTIGDRSISEGNSGTSTLNLPITLSRPSATAVTVQITTADQTATAGSDYTAVNAVITIPAGATMGYAAIPIRGDTVAEANETFSVTLSNAVGATIFDAQGIGTIVDDDAAATSPVAITIGDAMLSEGNSGSPSMQFPIMLSRPSATAITVRATSADGTATIAGKDYYALDKTITIPAGATTGYAYVGLRPDTVSEANETFVVNLTAAVGGVVTDSQGIGTIADDDVGLAPTLSIGNAAIAEGNSGTTTIALPITLSTPSATDTTVQVTSADLTATLADHDYYALSKTITIPAGKVIGYAYVGIRGDTKVEPDETLAVNLTNPVGATIAVAQGIATILNDDGGP
jgi:glucose/arabinose dehydrogenase